MIGVLEQHPGAGTNWCSCAATAGLIRLRVRNDKGCYSTICECDCSQHQRTVWGPPRLLQRSGKNAIFAADEFFSACLSNPHTRRAYAHPVGRFLTWCDLAHTSGTTL